jgi:hypothetical protein
VRVEHGEGDARVLPALQKDGLVRKEGRGWYPTEAA